ncbi:MAG: HmuY family protein [Myxococcota bacterium]
MTTRLFSLWAIGFTLGCEPAADDPSQTDPGEAPMNEVISLVVDATDRETFAYVDLDTATVLGPEAASSADWELAIRRFEIRTNGGDSGSGQVMAGLAVDPEGFYDASGEPVVDAFVQADAEAQLAALTTPFTTPALSSDRIEGVFSEDWFDYNPQTGIATANLDIGWLIRNGEGDGFARVRMNDLDFPTREGNGIQSFSVAVEVEDAKGLQKPVFFEGSVPGEGGEVCYDMEADENVPCTGTAWDLMLGFSGRDSFIYTNSGDIGDGAGGALGPYPWKVLETYTRASASPEGSDLSPRFFVDETQSVFSTESWYAYDLQNQFRLYPNYRVYAVQVSDEGPLYGVQVAGYYDDADVAGHVTLRFLEL